MCNAKYNPKNYIKHDYFFKKYNLKKYVIGNNHVTRNNSKKNKDEQDEHDVLSKFPFYGTVNILPRNVPMHQRFYFIF
jgi:hypothetical protein